MASTKPSTADIALSTASATAQTAPQAPPQPELLQHVEDSRSLTTVVGGKGPEVSPPSAQGHNGPPGLDMSAILTGRKLVLAFVGMMVCTPLIM
jgi:hypothetical protein